MIQMCLGSFHFSIVSTITFIYFVAGSLCMAQKGSKKSKSRKSTKGKSTKSKKTRKKSSKSEKPSPKSSKERVWESPIFFIAVLAGLMIVFAIVAYFMNGYQDAGESQILATVNGESIMQDQLDFQYQLLPSSYKQQLSKEEVLEQIVNEELIVQRATGEGVSVSDEQLNERVQEILSQGGLSISDLQNNLDFFNITMDEFESLVRRQLIIQEYTQQVINVSGPDEQDLRDLYAVTKDRYREEEQVTARHVLISSQREGAAKLAQEIYDRARAGEDFCVLVENYTDDAGSRATCGEYTFPRNFMVPEFEEAAFGMEPGQYRLIQTSFGYHIIHKIEDVPASTPVFEDVRDQLEQAYLSAERSRQYEILISDLRDAATIEYAPGWGIYETPEQANIAEPEAASGQESDAVDDSGATGEQEILECIASETILYGASWSTDTRDAIAMFEDHGVEIEHVFCDQSACEGIEAYPTWVIGGDQFLGRMSLEDLQHAAGCE